MTTIDYFGTGNDAGDYSFLSNFFYYLPSRDWSESRLITVEHRYQAAKTEHMGWKEEILKAKTPTAAKKLGRVATLRPDWEEVKLTIMEELLREKFYKGFKRDGSVSLKTLLLATEDAELVEGNWWGDKFWGISDGEGENHLGKLLMKIRDDLR